MTYNYKITNQDEFDQFVIDEEIDLSVEVPPAMQIQIDATLKDRGKFMPAVQVHVISRKDNITRLIMFAFFLEILDD